MKIQAPINNNFNIKSVVSLDCDEFYAGIFEAKGNSDVINYISRRGGRDANFTSLNKLKDFVRIIKKNQKKVFITINEHFYPKKIKDKIFKHINSLMKIGVDGFIVSDINLIIKIRERFPDCYLIGSTGLHIMNSESVLFYKELGINRIILPRHLTIEQIKEIVGQNKDSEFEIFIKNDDCINIDGLCSFVHGNIGNYDFDQFCKQINLPNTKFRFNACGLCALFNFKNTPNLSLKIAGRAKSPESIKKDIIFTKKCLEILKVCKNKSKFQEEVKRLYHYTYNHGCKNQCYYNLL